MADFCEHFARSIQNIFRHAPSSTMVDFSNRIEHAKNLITQKPPCALIEIAVSIGCSMTQARSRAEFHESVGCPVPEDGERYYTTRHSRSVRTSIFLCFRESFLRAPSVSTATYF